jgi:UTP--glucose-1-phosphate uridylyltransferase
MMPLRAYDGTMSKIRKAVIPAAGRGVRFLPATKATPKEMLPVVDKPAIQYVVEEAAVAGLTDILMITGRNKRPLEDHFDRATELEAALIEKNDGHKLKLVQASSELARIHYVRQGEPQGLGHAVLQAADHVGDEPFVVLLGDDLIDERDPILPAMIKVQEEFGGSVVCLMEVPADRIHLYGCAAIETQPVNGVVVITDLVEKPSIDDAPSNLAIIGRYVLDAAVFKVLEKTAPGKGGEIQLTDALRVLATMPADQGGGVRGVVFSGRRYDTGDRLSWLQSTVQLALHHPELGKDFTTWLEDFVKAGMPDA